MKQVILQAPEDIRVIEVPRPVPGSDEVLIQVASVGICGSDLHAYHGRHPFITLPVVPGHEFSGTVVEVGEAVVDFDPGDRVTVEPSLVCGKCYNCLHGRYNICEELQVVGCQTTGAMAEFVAIPAAKVLPLPHEVTWDQATMVEPLAVGVHAARLAGVTDVPLSPGAEKLNVVILGAGTIGLMTLQALKTLGAGRVLVTDRLPERLTLARRFGADAVFDARDPDLLAAVEALFGPQRADVIIECVGSAATIRSAIAIARKGTRIVLAGVFEEEVMLPLGLVQDRELELVGALMYANGDFPTALNLLWEMQVQTASLIGARFPLEQAAEAFAFADSYKGAPKVLIEMRH